MSEAADFDMADVETAVTADTKPILIKESTEETCLTPPPLRYDSIFGKLVAWLENTI